MFKKLKGSLKFKLIAMFVVFISVPLAVLGGVSSTMASDAMQHATEQEMRELSNSAGELIENALDASLMLVEVMSHNTTFASAVQGDRTGYDAAYKSLGTLQSETEHLLEMIVLVNKNAQGIMTNTDKSASLNLSDRAYVQKALSGEVGYSPVIQSKASGEVVVAIAYPMKSNGEIIGAIIGTVRFDNLTKFVEEIQVGESGYAYLIDRDGLILSHPTKENILTKKLDDFGIENFENILADMKAGNTGDAYYTYKDVYKFVHYIPVGEWTLAVTANYDEYMLAAHNIRNITLGIMGSALVVSILLAYIMSTKNIIKPIKSLEELMSKAGEGDLRVRSEIKTGDEIEVLGKNFNTMMESQSEIIKRVREGVIELSGASEEMSASAEEISASSEQIASNIGEVAGNASEQNSKIVETSEVLVQLSSLIQIAQKRAKDAHKNSESTLEVAHEGRGNVDRTVSAIEGISDAAITTTDRLENLNELSKKVSGIVTTINNIADQTNLLALNANIEAARAGEHGRGFSVVADEVRILAEQTNSESNEIAEVVNEMVTQIEKAVESMAAGSEAVEHGIGVAKDTDKSFLRIVESFEMIGEDIDQIVDITRDEVASSDQILKLIDTVASITEMTAANSEEVAAAAEEQTSIVQNMAASSEETSAMATTLSTLVERFLV